MSTETLVEELAHLTPAEREAVEEAAEKAVESGAKSGSVYLGSVGEAAVKGKDF